MPVHDKIGDYEAFKMYHGVDDLLTPTHSLIDCRGALDMFIVAFELPKDEVATRLVSYIYKEIDAATRFSIGDGIIQIEVEVWDGDKDDKMYFCGDLTVKQAITILNHKHYAIGFVPVGKPDVLINVIKLFGHEDLARIIATKKEIDQQDNLPRTWKVG